MSDDKPLSPLAARQASLFKAEADLVTKAMTAARDIAVANVRQEGDASQKRVREALQALDDAQPTLDRLKDAEAALSASEGRLRAIRRGVWGGVVVAALLATLVVLCSFWIGQRQIAAARTEAEQIVAQADNAADTIRAASVDEIARVQQEADVAIAAAREDAASRQADAMEEISAVGAELASMEQERDSVRDELMYFADLRQRMGVTLGEHFNGKPVIIVGEAEELYAWNPPALSELNRFRGRIWRIRERSER